MTDSLLGVIALLLFFSLLQGCEPGGKSDEAYKLDHVAHKVEMLTHAVDSVESSIDHASRRQKFRDDSAYDTLRRIWLQGIPGENDPTTRIVKAFDRLDATIRHEAELTRAGR